MLLTKCKESPPLIKTLRENCRTIAQVHQVHAQAITGGLLSLPSTLLLTQILYTFTSLLAVSPPSGSDATRPLRYVAGVFHLIPHPSTFCYNTIIRAHTLLSSPRKSIAFFAGMAKLSIPPDTHTFPFALKACAEIKCLRLSKSLHCQALRFGFLDDIFVFNNLVRVYCVAGDICGAYNLFDETPHRDLVSYNAMIDGFVKVGETAKARELFGKMPEKDEISWATLLAGYAKMNQCKEAIELFDQMLLCNVKPDNTALVAALSACAQLGELEKGKWIHEYILQNRRRINEFLITGLVDLYGKCGCIETAIAIFDVDSKNLCTWNAMLVGLAMHGHGKILLDYFEKMVNNGVKPDRVTFLGVLVGCSHAGLTDEARKLFAEMDSVHGVPKELKHYGCMADLLGRAGLIEEALEMIKTMPMQGDIYVWGGLLGGCRMHGNIEVAERAALQLVAVKPEDGGVYSVLANLYANAERWDDLLKIRALREGDQVRRRAGCSSIQSNGETHEFVSGDDLHPLVKELYFILNVFEQHKLGALS